MNFDGFGIYQDVGTTGALTSIPVDNCLFVMKNGDNGTGTRGRFDLPYETVEGAQVDSVSGDTIIVYGGTYNEKNLLKDGVNLHFMEGAIVNYTGSDDGAIFDDSATGTGGAVTCNITGQGQFTRGGTGNGASFKSVVFLTEASNIYLEAKSIEATTTVSTPFYLESGTLLARIDDSITGNGGSSVYAEAGATLTVYADIINDAFASVYSFGGTINVFCNIISGSAGGVLSQNSGEVNVHCDTITNSGTNSDFAAIESVGGTINFEGRLVEGTGNGDVVKISQVASIIRGKCTRITGASTGLLLSGVVSQGGGTMEISALSIENTVTDNVVVMNGGIDATSLLIQNAKMQCAGSDVINFNLNGEMRLEHCRIENTNDTGGNGILIRTDGTPVLILDDVTFVLEDSTAFDVTSTIARDVKVLQAMSNVLVKDADITEQINSILRDTNVL